jgi:predicted permease
VAALVGLMLAALPWRLPEVVYEPFRVLGAAAAPMALVAFGMSLAIRRPHGQRLVTRELALVMVLRAVVHPLLATLIGHALGLDGAGLLAVVTMAALPTAQNVLVYALQYGRGQALARDAGLMTTLLTVPVMLVIAATLG